MYTFVVYMDETVIRVVRLSVSDKVLRKLPRPVVAKLLAWVASVEAEGLEEVRKIPGYHDEALRGERKGQRSIRLNRSYRAIYVVEREEATVEVEAHEYADVIEAHKHKY